MKFYGRLVPQELLQRYNATLAFSDEAEAEVLSFFVGGGQNPANANITFVLRRNTFVENTSLGENVLAHAARSDKLLDLFDSQLVSLLVKT